MYYTTVRPTLCCGYGTRFCRQTGEKLVNKLEKKILRKILRHVREEGNELDTMFADFEVSIIQEISDGPRLCGKNSPTLGIRGKTHGLLESH